MKSIRTLTVLTLSIFLLFSIDCRSPRPVYGLEVSHSVHGIGIEPDRELFNINNMIPGDKITRHLKVRNQGTSRFRGYVSLSFKDGSHLLFDNLNLEINKDKVMKYQGKMVNLDRISLGVLDPNAKSDLDITVEFPPESGREYQRLTTRFDIIIDAEQVLWDDDSDPDPNPKPKPNPGDPGDTNLIEPVPTDIKPANPAPIDIIPTLPTPMDNVSEDPVINSDDTSDPLPQSVVENPPLISGIKIVGLPNTGGSPEQN